jgi:hypothetical protein
MPISGTSLRSFLPTNHFFPTPQIHGYPVTQLALSSQYYHNRNISSLSPFLHLIMAAVREPGPSHFLSTSSHTTTLPIICSPQLFGIYYKLTPCVSNSDQPNDLKRTTLKNVKGMLIRHFTSILRFPLWPPPSPPYYMYTCIPSFV